MRISQLFPHRGFAIVFILLLLIGCNDEERKAKPLPPDIGNYVYAFTTGTISRNADIRVQFAGAVVGEDQVGLEADGSILQIEPAVQGTAQWEDSQTLVFQPARPLRSGTAYVVTVRLEKLYKKLPPALARFEFDFRVRDMAVDVYVDGMEAVDVHDLSRQQIKGILYTSDAVAPEKAKELLSATQNNRQLDIIWQHQPGDIQHDFTLNNVHRTQSDEIVNITWNGEAIGSEADGKYTMEIPPLGTFKVMDARVSQKDEQYVQIQFSDPLMPNQDLEGLVTVQNYTGNLRYIINGNKILVYPSKRLRGTHIVQTHPGIKNINGNSNKRTANWTLSFEQDKPAVRLVGWGIIMPNSAGLTFPFEAVSLNAVEVEIVQIYNNNILQFLQYNELDGSNDLHRVGRIILQKKVPLGKLNPDANPSLWTRYALDLGSMIQRDPNAIYQVRLGFRPEYATYFCEGQNKDENAENDNLVKIVNRTNEQGEINSFWDGYYGIDGYYEGYEWRHRENPCYPAYYNADKFVRRNVLASDLGITAKKDKDGSMTVILANLKNTEPVAGATVTFYNYQQQVIASATTGADGMARTNPIPGASFIIAAKEADKGYLRIDDGKALSLSKFDVAGTQTQEGLKGFLYGERGVWRPGDTLHLNFILNDENNPVPATHPLTFELYDPHGQLQQRKAIFENVNGIYDLTTGTRPSDPTGNWMASVKIGGATFTKVLKIETVKPNRLKVNLDFGKEILTAEDNKLSGTISSSWLHGAPADGLEAKVEMELQAVPTHFDKFPDFQFDDPARRLNIEPRVIFDQKLNEQGKGQIKVQLLKNKSVPGKLAVRFKSRVFEKSGNFSTGIMTLPFFPYTTFTGVSLPTNEWGHQRLDAGKEGTLQFAAVTPNGQPAAGKNLKAGIYKVDWNWWWESDRSNVSKYNSTNHFNALESTDLTTKNDGRANWKIKLRDYGRYLVRVCDQQSGHCSGAYFYVGYPWYDEDGSGRSEAVMLSFKPEKEKYSVGEEITLNVPAGESGKILLALENGTRVLTTEWRDVQKGNNKISFKANKDMVPTLYAHISLIQAHGQTVNDLPIRMYGVVPIEIDDPSTQLQPVLKMPAVLKPEQKVTLSVSETNGTPMAYTIAMVDEGLLDLTRFKTPNPHEAFFAKEALGVKTWDLYDYVLGAFGGELSRILSIGGDTEIQRSSTQKNANRFEPVVRHLGPFKLQKGATQSHTIVLPNYVGSVRTMVVAAADDAYGATEKTTPVRKPLMVLATLPRVLGPGEKLRLPVNVFAMEPKVKAVSISVKEKSGLVQFKTGKSREIRFNSPGDKIAYFDVEVGQRTGIATFTIQATGAGEKASQTIEIEIRNPNPFVSSAVSEVLQSSQNWNTAFELPGMPGTNTAVLEVSSIPPLNLERRLDFLIRYPFGCLEQTLSSGFPQLYLSNILELDKEDKAAVEQNITATIEKLRDFQNKNGAFTYWPQGNINHWSNSYAGHFLLEAKSQGYALPAGMLERWINFQKKLAKRWSIKDAELGFYGTGTGQLTQAYRLYTLALAGTPVAGAMNRLRESAQLNNIAAWKLAGAYALAGKDEVAQSLINTADIHVEDYRELSYTFGSDTRDRAIILETLVLLGERKKAAALLKTISEELSANKWLSTQTIGYSLLAIGKFIGASQLDDKFTFEYQFGNKKIINAGSRKPVVQISVPISQLSDLKIRVKNTGANTIFASLILNGQPAPGFEEAQASKIKIETRYLTLDNKVLNPADLKQGTDFVAEVTVTNPGIYTGYLKEMALVQIFPSGWEIINTRLEGLQRSDNTARPKYQDFRDDRVNTFFDIASKKSQTYRLLLNAAYEGTYYLPATNCEAMYDNSIYARSEGRWVQVTRGTGI